MDAMDLFKARMLIRDIGYKQYIENEYIETMLYNQYVNARRCPTCLKELNGKGCNGYCTGKHEQRRISCELFIVGIKKRDKE